MKKIFSTFAIASVAVILMSFTAVFDSWSRSESFQTDSSEPLKTRMSTADRDAIVGKQWKLVEVEGRKIIVVEDQEQPISFTLSIEENKVTGFDGCNTISGEYSLDMGTDIHFSNLASTKKLCQNTTQDERSLIDVLYFAHGIEIIDSKLIFSVCAEDVFAVFEEM